MRAILVDDEDLALTYLERVLMKIGSVRVIGKYTNPTEALKAVLADKPDVVFLDIEMPEVTGIELANKIRRLLPDIHVVFVTAFNEYAVKAFELNAVDYVMKPIQQARLRETLNRISINHVSTAVPTRTPIVRSLQSLTFAWSDDFSELVDVRWRTSKVRGVFSFLLQHRGSVVQKDTLSELFWPEIDWEKGFMQLYSAIYQVRKTISSINSDIVIANHENGYKLELNGVKFDVDEWENGLKENPTVTRDTLEEHQKLLDLYRGDYLAKEDYIWAESERERLRVTWLNHMSTVADFFEAEGQYAEAISLYLRMQMAQPHVDYSYFKLLQLYSKIDRIRAVEQQYEKLKQVLLVEYGVEPRAEIQTWYNNWLKDRSHTRLESTKT